VVLACVLLSLPVVKYFDNKSRTARRHKPREERMPKTQLVCLMVAVYTLHIWLSTPLEAHVPYREQGVASWYGKAFAGRPTASGTPFSPREMTAAHRTLPLGTKVMVQNLATGDQTEVKITDRGPYADPRRRIIDLSRAAATKLGLLERGLGRVQVAVTEPSATVPAPKEAVFYVVQVGAFAEYAEAQWVLAQLQDGYAGVYIEARQGPTGRYYRVRLGPFATEAHAAQVAHVLKGDGHAIFVDEISALARPDQIPEARYAWREQP
jgi:rare lipoprotein A